MLPIKLPNQIVRSRTKHICCICIIFGSYRSAIGRGKIITFGGKAHCSFSNIIVSPRRGLCRCVATRLLYLLHCGAKFFAPAFMRPKPMKILEG